MNLTQCSKFLMKEFLNEVDKNPQPDVITDEGDWLFQFKIDLTEKEHGPENKPEDLNSFRVSHTKPSREITKCITDFVGNYMQVALEKAGVDSKKVYFMEGMDPGDIIACVENGEQEAPALKNGKAKQIFLQLDRLEDLIFSGWRCEKNASGAKEIAKKRFVQKSDAIIVPQLLMMLGQAHDINIKVKTMENAIAIHKQQLCKLAAAEQSLQFTLTP